MTNLELLERLCLDKNVGLRVSHDFVEGKYRCEIQITNGDFDMKETVLSDNSNDNMTELGAYRVFREMFAAFVADKKEYAIKMHNLING